MKSVHIRSYSGPYSVRMRKNTDQNNSEHGHFLHSDFIKRKDLMNRQKHLAEMIFSFYSKLADYI